MLHRVERRELTCAHVLAHPLATYHNLPCFYYSFSSIHGISISPPNSHQCPASPLTSTPSPMPSSKAAESCFLLQHNHNRATSDTANTCQTQNFHSYTSSYYVQQGHHRQLYKAWKAHTAPVSQVQFIGSTEKGRLATAFSPGTCWGFFW